MTLTPDLEPFDQQEQIRVKQQPGGERQIRFFGDTLAQRRQMLFRFTQFSWLIAGGAERLVGLRVLLNSSPPIRPILLRRA